MIGRPTTVCSMDSSNVARSTRSCTFGFTHMQNSIQQYQLSAVALIQTYKTTFFVKVAKLHEDTLVVKGWGGKICCAL